MIERSIIEGALDSTLAEIDLPLGERIRGKVRESFVHDDQRHGQVRTIVASDRISAFDVVLGTIPFKGQVLNGIAAHWFEQTRDLAPNHLIEVPDPAVSVVRECEVFAAEVIVRGYLTGSSPTSIWTHYDKGVRDYCGHRLPDGLHKHQALPDPIITPTTKAGPGEHDELTTGEQLVARGVFTAEQYERVSAMSLALFAYGTKTAAERGLILVDTKYELGRTPEGEIVFVDEVHTPDSSRFWYASSYREALRDGGDPRALDKDYVRRWLVEQGYRGEGKPPQLPAEVRIEAASRYIEIFEQITGKPFEPALGDPVARIKANLQL